jgi:hypothetical protein
MSATNERVQPEEHVAPAEVPRPVISLGMKVANYLFFLPLTGLTGVVYGIRVGGSNMRWRGCGGA